MLQSNVKIVLENGLTLEYSDASDLVIKLNRIVDDFSNPSKRFGEFSYTFTLPITKNNRMVWEYPDAKGRTRIFKGKEFACKVFNGSNLLLDGLITLSSFDKNNYKCLFYSKVTQLLDDLKGKKLIDMVSLPTVVWEYELSVVNHINGSNKIEHVEFPLIFYRTPFMQGATDVTSSSGFPAEANLGYFYSYVNTFLPFANKNPLYYAQYPPAIYLKSILQGMLNESGWAYGGSFFEGNDLDKIIIPFAGDPEDFSGSIITGSTNYLNLNKILPDVSQIDFLNSIINAFDLYFTIDPKSKQINFETYNVLFNDTSNAYDITGKIDFDSIEISSLDEDTSISFGTDSNNDLVAGYGRLLDYSRIQTELNPTRTLCVNQDIRLSVNQPVLKESYNKNAFENLHNKVSGDKSIKLQFTPVNYMPYTIINEFSIDGIGSSSIRDDNFWTVGLPLISEQTPQDNKGYSFASDSGDTFCIGASSNNWTYSGGLKMLYYYGTASWNYKITGSTDQLTYNDFVYNLIATGGTCSSPTFVRVPVTVSSPYKLMTNTEKNNLLGLLQSPTFDKYGAAGAEAHNLLMTYYSVGTTGNTHTPTKYSLTLGENSLLPNLYSTFHETKYLQLENGYEFTATMRMNSYDWAQMQMHIPIKYNDELYRLIAIKNYDPVNRSAEVTLLKRE